jgi:hypothetical protein
MSTLGLVMTLIVRLYDNGTLSDADRAFAIETASGILLSSNVPTTWPECRPRPPRPPSPAAGPAACDQPMTPGEVSVRIVRGTAPSHPRTLASSHLSLGYSLIDPETKGGALATIYLDRVEWVARDSGTDPRVVLGRAIAHEIGHLLLGTNRHADAGLMRARWSRQALERDHAADWLFTIADGEALLRALARRSELSFAPLEDGQWGFHDDSF